MKIARSTKRSLVELVSMCDSDSQIFQQPQHRRQMNPKASGRIHDECWPLLTLQTLPQLQLVVVSLPVCTLSRKKCLAKAKEAANPRKLAPHLTFRMGKRVRKCCGITTDPGQDRTATIQSEAHSKTQATNSSFCQIHFWPRLRPPGRDVGRNRQGKIA